jgi:acetyl esterase/lipase
MPTDRRGALSVVAGAVSAALVGPDAAAASRPMPGIDPLAHVAPELRATARRLLAGEPLVLSDATLARMRAGAAAARFPSDPRIMSRMVPVRRGWPDVPVLVIGARAGAKRPVLLHLHGGGFVGGSAREVVPRLLPLADTLSCVVVTIDYRLAPEARYDVAIEEDHACLTWVYREADALGIDRDRIALLGESAGGGHAALLSLTARDRGEVPVAFQALVYPMLDDRTGSSRQLPPAFGSVGWTPGNNRFAWRSFLGREPGDRTVPSAAVPARRHDLAGLPPTFIGVGGIDLFASEDIDFARRLLEAGVPTELLVVPGAFHGFDRMAPDTGIAQRFTAAKIAALARAFATKS